MTGDRCDRGTHRNRYNVIYLDMTNILDETKNDVLTLMIHLGYLTWQEEEDSGFARIPNEEIRMEFNGMLRKGKHPELIRLVRMSDQLLEKPLAGINYDVKTKKHTCRIERIRSE